MPCIICSEPKLNDVNIFLVVPALISCPYTAKPAPLWNEFTDRLREACAKHRDDLDELISGKPALHLDLGRRRESDRRKLHCWQAAQANGGQMKTSIKFTRYPLLSIVADLLPLLTELDQPPTITISATVQRKTAQYQATLEWAHQDRIRKVVVVPQRAWCARAQ